LKNNRQKRIWELQIKNRRVLVQKEVEKNFKGYVHAGFLEIAIIEELKNKIYAKIDKVPKRRSLSMEYEQILEVLLGLDFRSITDNPPEKQMVLFYEYNGGVDGLFILLEIFMNNIQKILEFVGFTEGRMDLLYTDANLGTGICIERFEYMNILTVW